MYCQQKLSDKNQWIKLYCSLFDSFRSMTKHLIHSNQNRIFALFQRLCSLKRYIFINFYYWCDFFLYRQIYTLTILIVFVWELKNKKIKTDADVKVILLLFLFLINIINIMIPHQLQKSNTTTTTLCDNYIVSSNSHFIA